MVALIIFPWLKWNSFSFCPIQIATRILIWESQNGIHAQAISLVAQTRPAKVILRPSRQRWRAQQLQEAAPRMADAARAQARAQSRGWIVAQARWR